VKHFVQNHGLFLFFLTASLSGHIALKWLGPAIAFEPQLGQLESGRTSISVQLIAAAPRTSVPQEITPPETMPVEEPLPIETPTPEVDADVDHPRESREVEIPVVTVNELVLIDEAPIDDDATTRPPPERRRQAQEPRIQDAPHAPIARQAVSHLDLPDAEAEIPRTLVSQASSGADVPPGFVSRPLPPYPPDLLVRGVESTVFLRVTIGRDGRVDDVALHRSSGYAEIDRSALETVPRWVFSPARRGSEPVVQRVIVPIEYKIRR
jgi:protein TonB